MLIKETASINFAAVSPNRLWLAYDSTSAGSYHIYVLPIAGAGGRVQVSALEGNTPRWSADGKELFFRSGRSLMAVDVHTVKDGIDFTNQRKPAALIVSNGSAMSAAAIAACPVQPRRQRALRLLAPCPRRTLSRSLA